MTDQTLPIDKKLKDLGKALSRKNIGGAELIITEARSLIRWQHDTVVECRHLLYAAGHDNGVADEVIAAAQSEDSSHD